MVYSKKITAIISVAVVAIGGVLYFGNNIFIDDISSSALSTPFVCSSSTLKSQEKNYKTTINRKKKAVKIQQTLEKEIQKAGGEVEKQQDTLKKLKRQILIYNKFIQKYETCKKEANLFPTVSEGVMSGEVTLAVTEKDYQAIAAFQISSPKNLNTYITSLQFTVTSNPAESFVGDTWFLLHEGADPIPCRQASETKIIECDMSGNMPLDIAENTARTYGLGTHIASMSTTGEIDIQITKILFNNGRITSGVLAPSKVLKFGTQEPLTEETFPSPITESIPAPIPTQTNTAQISPESDRSDTPTTQIKISETPSTTDTPTSTQEVPLSEKIPPETMSVSISETSPESQKSTTTETINSLTSETVQTPTETSTVTAPLPSGE